MIKFAFWKCRNKRESYLVTGLVSFAEEKFQFDSFLKVKQVAVRNRSDLLRAEPGRMALNGV